MSRGREATNGAKGIGTDEGVELSFSFGSARSFLSFQEASREEDLQEPRGKAPAVGCDW